MIYIYAVVSLASTRLVASPIAGIVAAAEAAEGDYRRLLIQLNSSAEAVALSGDAGPERLELNTAFNAVLRLRARIVLRHFGLNMLTYFMDYAGTVVNYMVLAAAVLAGAFGRSHSDAIVAISKGSGFTLMVIYGFSQIIDAASKASDLAGYTARITALQAALGSVKQAVATNAHAEGDRRTSTGGGGLPGSVRASDYGPAPVDDSLPLPVADVGEGVLLQARGLLLAPPTGSQTGALVLGGTYQAQPGSSSPPPALSLSDGLSFRVPVAGRVLLMGPSGCGKTSLLRLIRGLWRLPAGRRGWPGWA